MSYRAVQVTPRCEGAARPAVRGQGNPWPDRTCCPAAARPHQRSRRVVAGGTVGELSCLEHGFDIRELGRMTTRTVNTTTTATMSTTTTPAARPRPTPPRPKPARISVARQVKQQRRGYATAVLRTLARTHRGRPATQIHATLRGSLAPLGVRLTPATLRSSPPTSRPVARSNCPDQGNRPGAATWHTPPHGSG